MCDVSNDSGAVGGQKLIFGNIYFEDLSVTAVMFINPSKQEV